jgi:hypothetical protein
MLFIYLATLKYEDELVNDELEAMWKEVFVANHENFSQNHPRSGWDLNQVTAVPIRPI